jgi:hypothetical protein
MPSIEVQDPVEYPTEIIVGILFIGILAGLIADDVVVAMLFTGLASIAYLLYRILRTLQLIATKL